MAYNAPNADAFRKRTGSLAKKITGELGKLDTEIDKQKVHSVVLTAGMGTNTALATTGVDLASGSDAQYYGVFFAPHDITIVGMRTLLTEAYKKDTTDAKIELLDNYTLGAQTLATYALPGTGAVEGYSHNTAPVSAALADVNSGFRIDMKITATGDSSGTGHAVVILDYINR